MVVAVTALLLGDVTPALAHRVDEYLLATTISVARDGVQLHLRLTPGIEVVPRVLALVDHDRDGVLSPAEQRGYAERVVRDLSLSLDGERLPLRLVSWRYPRLDDMADGRGTIEIELAAGVAPRAGERVLAFANAHERAIAEYLANALVPTDTAIRIARQTRSWNQSRYELRYAHAAVSTSSAPSPPLVVPPDRPSIPVPPSAPARALSAPVGVAILALALLACMAWVARRAQRPPRPLAAPPETSLPSR